MPAWWLGPDLSVSTSDPRLDEAIRPVFRALQYTHPASAYRNLSLEPCTDEPGYDRIRFDGYPLARCRADTGLVFFLESLLTHLATHANRSVLVLHAGLVHWRGRTLLLPGERGSGKSTTTLSLARREGEYLGDDLCFLDPRTGAIRGLAKAATLKTGSFGLFERQASYPDPLRGEVRYFLPPRIRPFDADALHVDHLIFPRYTPGTTTRVTPVPRPLAALSLVQQSYGGGEWGRRGLEAVATLAQKPAHLIEYHHLDAFEETLAGVLG